MAKSRIATARQLAEFIWFGCEDIPMDVRTQFAASQNIGFPLAHGIVFGWVTGVSAEGLGHLETTAEDLKAVIAKVDAHLPAAKAFYDRAHTHKLTYAENLELAQIEALALNRTGIVVETVSAEEFLQLTAAEQGEPITICVDGNNYTLTVRMPDGHEEAVTVGRVITDSQGDQCRFEGADQDNNGAKVALATYLTIDGKPFESAYQQQDVTDADSILFPNVFFEIED